VSLLVAVISGAVVVAPDRGEVAAGGGPVPNAVKTKVMLDTSPPSPIAMSNKPGSSDQAVLPPYQL